MQLFYAPTSPFARIIRVALLELGLADQVPQHLATLRDPGSILLPYNVVGRVPTLELDNGVVLTETPLILTYLDTLHSGRPLLPRDGSDGWRAMARLGTVIGMIDSIAVWNRELRRPEDERSPTVLALEHTRTHRVLDALETACGYCDVRHKVCDWRTGRPALVAWFEALSARPSLQATAPRLD